MDRFDKLEREHEARSRAAAELAGVLGVGDDDEKPADDKGRSSSPGTTSVAPRVGPADAGERGIAPELSKSPADHLLDVIYDGDHRGGVSWTG